MIIEKDAKKLANETGVSVAVAAYTLQFFNDFNRAKNAILRSRNNSYDLNKSDSD